MFDFKKKILNPVINGLISKTEEALKIPSISDRIENLLIVKESTDKQLSEIYSREDRKVFGAAFLMIPGFGMWGLALIPAAPAAGTAAITIGAACASPLFIAGASVFIASIVFSFKKDANRNVIKQNQRILNEKINSEINTLVEAAPQETIKSPRLLQVLKDGFNPAAANNASYVKLKQQVSATPSPTVSR